MKVRDWIPRQWNQWEYFWWCEAFQIWIATELFSECLVSHTLRQFMEFCNSYFSWLYFCMTETLSGRFPHLLSFLLHNLLPGVFVSVYCQSAPEICSSTFKIFFLADPVANASTRRTFSMKIPKDRNFRFWNNHYKIFYDLSEQLHLATYSSSTWVILCS